MKLLSLFLLVWPGVLFAALRMAEHSVSIGEMPVKVYSVREDGASPREEWLALPGDSFPNFGKSIPALAAQHHVSVAVNANFYREDQPGAQIPIGLVVHQGRVFAFPNKFYPTLGVFDQAVDWDEVQLEASAVFISQGKEIRTRLCQLNAPATRTCAAFWDTGRIPSEILEKRVGLVFIDEAQVGLPLGEKTYRPSFNASSRAAVLQFPKRVPSDLRSLRIQVFLRGKRLGQKWQAVREAISGSHVLFESGSLPPLKKSWASSRQPRTLVGVDNVGRTWVAVFDGRRAESQGVSVQEAWRFVRHKFGARWALNLDGGGSSTLMFEGHLVNRPSDGFPRSVAVGFGAKPSKQNRSE